jgi:hypothetical protein
MSDITDVANFPGANATLCVNLWQCTRRPMVGVQYLRMWSSSRTLRCCTVEVFGVSEGVLGARFTLEDTLQHMECHYDSSLRHVLALAVGCS